MLTRTSSCAPTGIGIDVGEHVGGAIGRAAARWEGLPEVLACRVEVCVGVDHITCVHRPRSRAGFALTTACISCAALPLSNTHTLSTM